MRLSTACLLAVLLSGSQARPLAAVDYEADVKPILRQHCYRCHGSLRQKSGLRLDHVSFMRAGGDGGPALEPADDQARLLLAVRGELGERMPLESKPLSEAEIATLAAWVRAGAQAPDEPLPPDPRDHWAFRLPQRAPLPPVVRPDWSSPIDRFLSAEHARQGLTSAEPAAKNVLLRRVTFDLIGLPPTPAELRSFVEDNSPDAYERVVDRLLASPQYGERWGRHWMDVWRYSDWDGFGAEVRESQPHIWRWRDWIVESLNTDQPYDKMIEAMLAADEIAPEDESTLRATGFLARNWYRYNRNVWLEATVEHTGKAFLGITLNCARCHDHMYDPILQSEYYQFRAFFEPHGIRTDRLPGQADTKQDGLVRAYDSELEKPTFLFVRGNEAQPDKEHPLAPAVPRALGGDALAIAPVTLAATTYYPGLRGYVQQEVLLEAEARLKAAKQALAKANDEFDEALKKATQGEPLPTEKVATTGSQSPQPQGSVEKTDDAGKQAPDARRVVVESAGALAIAEKAHLAASNGVEEIRAKIAADAAEFANPPVAEAGKLKAEAIRAERAARLEQAKFQLMEVDAQIEKVRRDKDDASKKKLTELMKKLPEATKARETAQAALAAPPENYTHFTPVYPATSTGRRAALACWIASRNNPLTARVAINHMWMRHFGSPLVPTVFDFGLNGKRPTHPALLDWLAVELMDQGWRMKPIHRMIVTSAAYRMQSTSIDASNRARDPENQYLWRMNPHRLEAEAVRDATLAVADSLDFSMRGPELDESKGLAATRRSLYFRGSKEKKVPFLDAFDRPNVVDCYRRSETIVPQQALAMVNSSLTITQSRKLAGILRDSLGAHAENDEMFVNAAFERLLCRPAKQDECKTALDFLVAQARELAAPDKLTRFTSGEENSLAPAADPHTRARENLVHVLLNHNDFLTVR
ncbi:MAG TPA: DUF1553 domain-containing protein [Pirellulales bacterium]|jgi:mono/diheme cytochrome c family protein|nr:DUF1553 domain-containing protein [Pirellulales bacterium]